jgi:hypothetical protein
LFETEADEAKLSLFGLSSLDLPDEEVEVFPDLWESFSVFETISSQWRVGMGGPIGLDYNVIPLALKSLGIKQKRIIEILPDVRIMESAALRKMRENQDSK